MQKSENIEQERPVVFVDLDGRPVAAPEKYGREEEVLQGNIFTVTEEGRRRHYEMATIRENETEVLVEVRQVRPQAWKSFLLTGALIGSWFAIQALAGWIFG